MKLAILGAAGRMGTAVTRLAHADPEITIVGACDRADSPLIGKDIGEHAGLGTIGVALSADLPSALLGADVCIDFSLPSAVSSAAKAVAQANVAWVCGTTGLDDSQKQAVARAAEKVPVLWSPNMSIGVQVLAELVREAVKKLGTGYDIEIVETHHRLKADAPSGTAIRLAEAAEQGRAELERVYGRSGKPGARKANEIGVLALRGGDVIGDHSVHLLGDGERIELAHRATSRELFARGAIRAARVLVGRPAKQYSMAEIVSAL